MGCRGVMGNQGEGCGKCLTFSTGDRASVFSTGSSCIMCVCQDKFKTVTFIASQTPLVCLHLSLTMLRKSEVSPRPLTLSASARLSTTLAASSPACSDEAENSTRGQVQALPQTGQRRRRRSGELGTLQVGRRAPAALQTIGKLPVGDLRQSGEGGVAGDGHRRVEVAGRHGGQRAEHGAKLLWRSLLVAAASHG